MKRILALLLVLMILSGCVPEQYPHPPASRESMTAAQEPSSASEPPEESIRVGASGVEPLKAASCLPRFVPDGWKSYAIRLEHYSSDDTDEPSGYDALAFALPPGWVPDVEPAEDGFLETITFCSENGDKLFDIYGLGPVGDGSSVFPEAYTDEFSPGIEPVPREDLTVDGRRAARYVLPPVEMDGAPAQGQAAPTIYRIDSGGVAVGITAYPPLSRARELYPLLERVLATAAIYPEV